MRFFKTFFSRFVIVFLAIILQIAALLATFFWISEKFVWIYFIFVAMGVIVFLVILNKNKPASFKLPWLVTLLVLPIVGTILYITFGNLNLSRKSRKKIENEQEILKKFCNSNETTFNYLRDIDENAYGQAKYIENTSHLPVYEDCLIEYLQDGEVFFTKLVNELKNAKKYIFMEYFIVEYGKVWDEIYEVLKRKAREGVEVFFMYDDIGSVSKVRNGFVFDLRNEGINACKFLPFKPFVTVAHNNRDHRKITIIDGEIGFIGGINLADEYRNIKQPFGKWKDNAIMLKGKCVDSLIFMFVSLFNSNAIKKIDVSRYIVKGHVKYEDKGFISLYGDGPCPIYNDYIGKNVYLNIINQAKKYLYITTPYLIVDYEFLESLINAAKRGVDVKIITPHVPDKRIIYIMTRSNYKELIEGGVKIYEYKPGFIHAKMFVCDDEYAVIGTINLDYRSLVHHFECGAWIYNNNCIYDMKNDFEKIIVEESIELDSKNSKLNFIERLLKNILRIIAPLM